MRSAALFVPFVVAAVALGGCTGHGTSTSRAVTAGGSGASSGPSPTGAAGPTGSDALGGDDGEGQPSSQPRSTVITTPTPKLSTPTGGAEVDGTCPYISNADFQEFEGDRVGRVTVIETKPVGCRFYFAYDESQVIGEVTVQQFADAASATNAMILSAHGHPEVQSQTTLGDGAVAYRTVLQGEATWQCVVTIGNRDFTVRTRQTYPAKDAFNLAAAVVRTVRP